MVVSERPSALTSSICSVLAAATHRRAGHLATPTGTLHCSHSSSTCKQTCVCVRACEKELTELNRRLDLTMLKDYLYMYQNIYEQMPETTVYKKITRYTVGTSHGTNYLHFDKLQL